MSCVRFTDEERLSLYWTYVLSGLIGWGWPVCILDSVDDPIVVVPATLETVARLPLTTLYLVSSQLSFLTFLVTNHPNQWGIWDSESHRPTGILLPQVGPTTRVGGFPLTSLVQPNPPIPVRLLGDWTLGQPVARDTVQTTHRSGSTITIEYK